MNPWKGIAPLVFWIMRIAIVLVIVANFAGTFLDFGLGQPAFYIATGFIAGGMMLFFGGFFKRPTLTVVAGLLIFTLSAIKSYLTYEGLTPTFSLWLLSGSVALFFVATGNK